MNPKVDFYYRKAGTWEEEIALLRTVVLGCGLAEELKWGVPCYTLPTGNVVLIHVFKDYCALLFFKGALMTDPQGILVQQTAQVQAARQLRFTGVREIAVQKQVIEAYIMEAIGIEKSGLKVAMKAPAAFEVAPEFQSRLDELPDLKKAFDALTPGRQRTYLLHFSSPKQSKTRESRVEKCMPLILDGKGLND